MAALAKAAPRLASAVNSPFPHDAPPQPGRDPSAVSAVTAAAKAARRRPISDAAEATKAARLVLVAPETGSTSDRNATAAAKCVIPDPRADHAVRTCAWFVVVDAAVSPSSWLTAPYPPPMTSWSFRSDCISDGVPP